MVNVVKLKKPRGDPELIATLVAALGSARAGKLRAASVCIIADNGRWNTRMFCGSSADNTHDKMALLGLLERTKHNMLSALLDDDCAHYADNGSFDPDPSA
jgi:hypothetical protein